MKAAIIHAPRDLRIEERARPAEDAARQATQGDGNNHTQDHHSRVVVIIEKALLGSHGPLKIVCRKKEKKQTLGQGCGFPKAPQTEDQCCQAAPRDNGIAN